MMKTIKLSKEQAWRLGVPELAGKEVSVTFHQPGEKGYAPHLTHVAKDVYYKGNRIGGTLDTKK